jgi:pyridoxal phosphate enzyme (YggS family)
MSIAENLNEIQASLPSNVTLVAVSKTKPNEALMEAYDAGQRIFGENKVQELAGKAAALPRDIEWHMIGHLQRNKVKVIAPFVRLIHGVDSMRLLEEINKQGHKNERVIDVLLQFHIAQETSKFGFDAIEAQEMLRSSEYASFENIRVVGVMGMATFTEDENRVRTEFGALSATFQVLKGEFFSEAEDFSIVSMGMSGDYKLAIGEGSTMVRVGSSIFGARNYIA